jgi:hypothetical protein
MKGEPMDFVSVGSNVYCTGKLVDSEKSMDEDLGMKQDNVILEYSGFRAH